jgi:serine/threonine protein phosphatase 1
MARAYAIGDVHGQLRRLHAAHARIAADRERIGDDAAPVIHLGDLVDRGPDSAGVIAHLAEGIAAGEPWVVLKGNHDRMFSGFLDDPFGQDDGLRPAYTWLHPALGGGPTLASYGVASPADRPVAKVHAEAMAKVPADHRDFLARLPLWHRRGEVLYVHAGIRPGLPLEAQTETDLVWIREPFLSATEDHGFLVVHGHTAIEAPEHHGNRINIDTRAGYGGPLTAIVLEGRDAFVLTDAGRVPLRPLRG